MTVLKRALDVAVAGVVLLAGLPVLALAALAILLEDGRPVTYTQPRAGQGGRVFTVFKFRTMRVHDVPAHHMPQVRGGDPLVTRTGAILRRLKIDELPQVLNVLRGDMTLVGPRPTLPEQVREYDAFARRRLEARPGMTGWAQVNGGTELPWRDRILLDVWYVDHASLWLDLRILARTVGVVLRGERVRTGPLEEARLHADGAGRRG
ncbi:MAG TPA: sugar transferase [Longimicrobium sp.]|jgi:lipopolysaccharide/colanic/teichoic acid biosynthesis glycosyltransferase|uniref:sugar transferase n=1 Tax=Longimicrobium sp. TaxID=2029185 RepID=UPI002EDA7488